MTSETTINTQGGTAITGNVNSSGGDIAGRDIHKHYYGSTPQPGKIFLNVPDLPAHFVGRDNLIGELVAALCAGQTSALSTAGVAGVGKTTLAVALARHPQVIAHFEGILWGGLGRRPDVASIQASWADVVGAKIDDLLDPFARSQRISNAIGTRRLLLVIDDAWSLEAAQQLRCSATQVVHLLTTRNQEIARQFARVRQSHHLPMLAEQPSVDLLRQLAPEAYDSDPAALRHLAKRVDGLPLALELLGGYLGASSQRRTQQRRQQALLTLSDPAARLALATQRLGDPSRQTVTLQQTIALSLQELPAATVAAFYTLGAFAAKPARFDLPAALAVSQASEEDLFALADCNLVEMDSAETLALHQTLADLAATQLPAEAVQRQRAHYLAIVDENRQDWQRIEAIYPQIGVAWSRLGKEDRVAIDFVDSLSTYQPLRGVWQDRLAWLRLAQVIAVQTEDKKAEARMLHELGYVYDALGEKQKALALYEQALPLRRQVGDVGGEATTLNNIGGVYADLGENTTAQQYFAQALALYLRVGDGFGEIVTRWWVAALHQRQGQVVAAIQELERALLLAKAVQSPHVDAIGRMLAGWRDGRE